MNKANGLKYEVSSFIAGNDFDRPSVTERAKQGYKRMIRIAVNVGIKSMVGYHTEGQAPVIQVAFLGILRDGFQYL